MTAAPALNFRRGGDEAAQVAKESRGGSFRKTTYFNLQDGESAFMRYITDWNEIYFVNQHQSYPTKNKPEGFTGNWPEFMPCVCRYDKVFGGFYKDCYPCDHPEITNKWGRPYKPQVRNWAVGILREEVMATADMVGQTVGGKEITDAMVGKRIGFRDQTREVEVPKRDKDDKVIEGEHETVTEPAFVIINMADSNYFDGLGAMAAAYEGTICDRDYLVRCKGEGKDKAYTHAAMAETPNLKPGTEKWQEKYLGPIAEIGDSLNIEKIIAERASDEYFARFIDPDKVDTQAAKGGSGSKGSSAPDVPKTEDEGLDESRLAEMRERLKQSGGATAPSSSLADVD